MAAASLDWGSVGPAVFGTLFERSLDPAKRAQLGAHYTGKEDTLRVVEPVVALPQCRRWAAVWRRRTGSPRWVRTESARLKSGGGSAPRVQAAADRLQATLQATMTRVRRSRADGLGC